LVEQKCECVISSN